MVATIKSAGTGAIASMIAGVIMMGWIVGVSTSPGNASKQRFSNGICFILSSRLIYESSLKKQT